MRWVSLSFPYLSVAIGLYLLRNAWVAMGLYHLGIIAVLHRERHWRTMRELVRGFHPRLLIAAVLLCLAGGGVTYVCWPYLGLPYFDERLARFGLTAGVLPWFFLYFSLVNPMLEEPFWRGYHGNASTRPAWSDLWFAGYHLLVLACFMHWQWLPLILIGLVATAWCWRLLARHLNGMLVNVASHISADAGIVVAVMMLVRQVS